MIKIGVSMLLIVAFGINYALAQENSQTVQPTTYRYHVCVFAYSEIYNQAGESIEVTVEAAGTRCSQEYMGMVDYWSEGVTREDGERAANQIRDVVHRRARLLVMRIRLGLVEYPDE